MGKNASPYYRWLVLSLVMTGTFMAILDASIVNVALPHMMGTFGVSRDKIEWVSTGFMLASAVVMPLVGWLVGRMGHKILYLGALTIFTLGSAACALCWSYDSLIIARIIQAIGGGAIQPVGMAIIADLFEPHERGKALGIWGTGIMIGPTIGPTLGGYLTEIFNWRSIFSVNLPFGLAALLVGMILMKSDRAHATNKSPFDWFGFLFLSMALVAGLLGLSKGQEEGWMSNYIMTCWTLMIIGSIMFIAIESVVEHPILDLKLFLFRNFSLSIILAVFRAIGLFGGVFLLPMFMENLVGYTTIQTGIWMMPGAISVGISMPFAGKLTDKYNAKWIVVVGSFMTGISLLFYGNLELRSGAAMIIIPQIIRGIGLAFMMTPLMTAALNAVPKFRIAMASSFLNVAQRVGGSFGIAMLNVVVTNSVRKHSVRMGEIIGSNREPLGRLTEKMGFLSTHGLHGIDVSSQLKSSLAVVNKIMLHANVLGFDNGFVLSGIIIIVAIPFCFMLKDTVVKKAARSV